MNPLKHLLLALLLALPTVALAEKPMPIKVVVVTMFETGEDTGDQAGEFQRWYERQKLTTVFPAPHMHHHGINVCMVFCQTLIARNQAPVFVDVNGGIDFLFACLKDRTIV